MDGKSWPQPLFNEIVDVVVEAGADWLAEPFVRGTAEAQSNLRSRQSFFQPVSRLLRNCSATP
jgi:hypothetical protein